MSKFLKRSYLALVLLFLYLPIVVLIVQSFNAGVSRAKWEGFSFRWYQELFASPTIMQALYVTLTIALLASIISTILGTLAAIGIHAMKRRPQAAMMTLTNIPMTMPDIVTGISLMLLFIFTRVDRGKNKQQRGRKAPSSLQRMSTLKSPDLTHRPISLY